MAGNFLVSSDEEKRINDILEKGIYEMKSNRNLQRKERDKNVDEFLRSSIGNINNLKETNANSNSNCEDNSKRGYTNLNIQANRNNHINEQNTNYFDKKYEENIPKNNININSNKENSLHQINHRDNLKLNTQSIKNNNKNISSNAKSSALRNLLDEMKQNSKYISSSEDECKYSQRFKGGILQTSTLHIPDKENQKNMKKDFDLYAELNPDLNSFRDLNTFKESEKMDPIIRTECTLSENSILLKDSCIRLNTPDLMKTNTLTPDNSYRNETTNPIYKEDFTPVHQHVPSIYSDIGNFSQLSDMHSEIKHLQNKIDGLEKKLKGSVCSNTHIGGALTKLNNKSNLKFLNEKQGGKSQFISKTKQFKRCGSDEEAKYNSGTNKFGISSNSNNKPIISSKNSSVSKEKVSKRSFSSNSERYYPEGSKLKIKTFNGVVKSKLDYKEKFEKIKDNYDSVKTTLVKERQIIGQLTNKNKKLMKKEENYDKLFKSQQELKEEHQKLIRKYEESEYIRKEQSKLIKSMQREIDLLRGHYDANLEINADKVIEEYKDIKNGLTIEKSSSNAKNIKKRKISRSKIKASHNL